MNVLTSLLLAVSVAATPGPIARAVKTEAARLTANGQVRANDTPGWSRVKRLAAGTEILLTTRGSTPTARVFVQADDLDISVLNLSGPSLPVDVTRTLRKMALESPERFAAMRRGIGYTFGDIHVGRDGVVVAGRHVADLDDILEQTSRTQVREVRTAKPRSSGARGTLGALAGAAGGFFAGIYVGAAIENEWYPCICDDPGLKGALRGAPIGAIAGGVLGYYTFRRMATEIIYRTPSN
jgi:hypothetical protein